MIYSQDLAHQANVDQHGYFMIMLNIIRPTNLDNIYSLKVTHAIFVT